MKDKRIEQTVEYIKDRLKDALPAPVAVILGSGLGGFSQGTGDLKLLEYKDIPHFTPSAVEGHGGVLAAGVIGDKRVLMMEGRTHFYEGHGMDRVIYPVRVMGQLGVKILIVTNACGGVNTSYSPGDLMVINDHINLMGTNPLIGENDPHWGARFPDMTYAYDPGLIRLINETGEKLAIPLKNGVYAAVTGPSYETRAEIHYLRAIGADGVGMSTVPEVITANHMGIKTAGISLITNMGAGVKDEPLSHRDVIKRAGGAKDRFERLLTQFIKVLG